MVAKVTILAVRRGQSIWYVEGVGRGCTLEFPRAKLGRVGVES